jgi:hypothetical protein
MLALSLCILAGIACYWAGRRSLGLGLIALFAVGYFYGILRANLLTVFSHFIFDVGMLGLYLSQKWTSSDPQESKRLDVIRILTALLILWPCFVVLMPFQPLLVSLVGLRGNVLFIPVLLLGSQLRDKDLRQLSFGLAALNIIALAFGTAEYLTSVTQFYPYSAVTQIIYNSADVAGGFYRIPAIFTSAHAYGGSMVFSLPYIIGGWQLAQNRWPRLFLMCGIGAAMVGVLMSATRQNFVLGCAMVIVTVLTTRMRFSRKAGFALIVVMIGWLAASNERFQRFTLLSDTDAVADRIAGSVNRGFFEILFEYPMGNGLGGGGTSIPYFLQGQVRNPIGMENEYSRILGEQGLIGLLLWLGFIFWFLTRYRTAFGKCTWANSRRMGWCLAVVMLSTALIGIGTFTSIPQTVMMLLSIGWSTTTVPAEAVEPRVSFKRYAGNLISRRVGPQRVTT